MLRAIQRHPWRTAVGVLLTAAALVGGYLYIGHYHWRSALRCIDDDDIDQARDHVEWYLWLHPRSVAGHLLGARIERHREDVAAAERHLRQCLALHGGSSEDIQLEWLMLRAQTGEFADVEAALMQRLTQ